MADAIVMPSLGMFTAEGELTAWLKPAGAGVEVGEPVVAVTTEKTTQEIAAPSSGILHPMAAVGALLPIQGLIGYILADGEAVPAPPERATGNPEVATPLGSPRGLGPPGSPGDPSGPGRRGCLDDPSWPGSPGGSSGPGGPGGLMQRGGEPAAGGQVQAADVRASPIARRLAAEKGVDLTGLVGSGPGGRIVEADVVAAIARGVEPKPLSTPQRQVRERIPLVGMRRTIADRLRSSVATTASVTLTREVDAEALVAARVVLAERLAGRLTYDALFVKLFGMALRAHIRLNAIVEDDAIVVLDEIHMGFAVAIPHGLVVPVVRNADSRRLAEVVETMSALAERAAANTLRPEDMLGGTATITNLGAYGVDAFSPILNPPQSVILGCGRIIRRPVVHADELALRQVCTLSLTFDHRMTDGVPAAKLLDQMAAFMSDAVQLDGLV